MWGLVAFSVLLWIWQRGQASASSLWALSLFLITALAVWVITSRRLTPHSTAPAGPSEASDAPAMQAPPEGVVEESCPVCARPMSSSDRRCACGAPRLTDGDRQRLRGPGGWLALYRFGLLVLGPLDVARLIASWLVNGDDFSTGDWLRVLPALLLVAGPTLYGVLVAALLTNERPESVRHARQYMAGNVICQAGLDRRRRVERWCERRSRPPDLSARGSHWRICVGALLQAISPCARHVWS